MAKGLSPSKLSTKALCRDTRRGARHRERERQRTRQTERERRRETEGGRQTDIEGKREGYERNRHCSIDKKLGGM